MLFCCCASEMEAYFHILCSTLAVGFNLNCGRYYNVLLN